MASSTSLPPSPDSDWASHDSGAQPGEHRELGFRRKYIFSTDHKVIGIQYGLCGLAFMFFAFCLMMMIRWQLAYPGQTLPLIGQFLPRIFGPGSMPGGKMTPEFYNSLGAIHGSIMIFAAVVPVAFAAFGNFVVPLQIGAPDMAFPKVNAASFWTYAVGGAITLGSPRILEFSPVSVQATHRKFANSSTESRELGQLTSTIALARRPIGQSAITFITLS